MLSDLFVLAVIVIGIALLPTALAIVGYALVAFMVFVLIRVSWEYPVFGWVVVLTALAITASKYPRMCRRYMTRALTLIRAPWQRPGASFGVTTLALPSAEAHLERSEADQPLTMNTVRIGDY